MIQIFINHTCIRKLLSQESDIKRIKNNWLKIIAAQTVIYWDSSCQMEWQRSNDEKKVIRDPLYYFFKKNGIKPIDKTSYINDLKNNHQRVLDYPSPVFLLDIPQEEAVQIQKEYGVICQSSQSLDDNALCGFSEPYIFKENEGRSHSWAHMLDKVKKLPSNSLIIMDRYLFAKEKELDGNIEGIYKILSHLIPISIKGTFTATILFDYEEANLPFDQIAAKLHERFSSLRDPNDVKLDIEIIGIKDQDKFTKAEWDSLTSEKKEFWKKVHRLYNMTHNRRVFGNYMLITFEHLVNAIKKDRKDNRTQIVNIETLFARGLNGRGDFPDRMHTILIDDLKKIIDCGRECSRKNTVLYKLSLSCSEEANWELINNAMLTQA